MNKKQLRNLLSFSDKELATIANRYKGYSPEIVQIKAGKVSTFTKDKAPDKFTKGLFDACKGFFDAWSSPKNCERLIEDILGKNKCVIVSQLGTSDGAETYTIKTITGKVFTEYLNVYDFEAFVSLIRKIIKWKLKN